MFEVMTMVYREFIMDLFWVPEEYYLTQCISADFKMGAGIALQFNRHFNMRNRLLEKYGRSFVDRWDAFDEHGTCLLEGRVFNLITKKNYWMKPTYDTLKSALNAMKTMVKNNPNVNKIAMPKIGCGLDGLSWSKVSKIIQEVFGELDVEILICK